MALPENLRAEFATLEKSFLTFAGLLGNTVMSNPDPTLRSRGQGLELALYDKIEKDPRAAAEIRQYKLEVISREWKLKPASTDEPDQRARDLVLEQLQNLGMTDYPLAQDFGAQGMDGVALNFLDADFKGYATGEVMWHDDGTRVIQAAEVRHRDQRLFGWARGERGWELRLLTRDRPAIGEAVPPQKIIYHSPNARSSNPYGIGLDSSLFWPVFFKNKGQRFWMTFAEKWADPKPIGKHPPGATQEQKDTLFNALRDISRGMFAAIPEGMVIEFLEATRNGSFTQEGLVRYLDEQIAELIVGQTGTVNQSQSGGSRAQDEVARVGMTAITRAASDLMSRSLDRTLIRWIVNQNRPVLGDLAKPPHLYWDFEDGENLKDLIEVDEKLWAMGWELKEEAVVARYGDNYQRRQQPAQPPVNLSDTLPATAQPLQFDEADPVLPPTQYPRSLTRQLADQAGPIIDGWVDQAAALMEATSSLEEFYEALGQFYPELDKSEFATHLQQGSEASHLGGMAEVDAEDINADA